MALTTFFSFAVCPHYLGRLWIHSAAGISLQHRGWRCPRRLHSHGVLYLHTVPQQTLLRAVRGLPHQVSVEWASDSVEIKLS